MFANNPRIVTDSLVGAWDPLMPDTATAATKLYDSAGSNDATMYSGGCLDFDGTDDDIYTTSDITMSGACTVAMWIYSEQSTQYLFSNRSGGPVNLMWSMSSNKLQYYYYVAPWKSMVSTSTIPQSTWTHIAWTRSSDNYISFFINGALDKKDQATNGSDVPTSTTVNGPVNIVGSYWSSAVFNGRMADFKVFSVELSPTQIAEMYKDSKVVVPYGIAHSEMDLWYPMSDGDSNIVYDGGGQTGSFLNPGVGQNFNDDEFLTAQTGPPQLIEGYNKPLLFKEVEANHVDWTNTQSLDDITLSAWVCPTAHNSYNPIIRLGGAFFLLDNSGANLRLVDGWATSPGSYPYPGGFQLNWWYHVAATRARNGNQILYVNGSALYTVGAQSSSISMGLVEIGRRSTNYFNGLINEVVVYDGALAASEIAKLAATDAAGRPAPPDPLTGVTGYNAVLGYYRNDGPVTWAERSGHSGANTATVYGSSKSTLLFREGFADGQDTQGFPLFFENNGAVGFTQTGGSKVTIPHSSNILWDLHASFTITTWYKHPSNPSGTYPSLWGKGGQNVSGPGYELFLNPSGTSFTLRATWPTGGTWGMTAAYGSAGNPRDGKWHCVAVVINRGGAQLGHLYQDNVKQSSVDISGLGDTTNTVDLTLGSAGAGLFYGQIAGARIYNRVLTDNELTQNFNAQRSRFNV